MIKGEVFSEGLKKLGQTRPPMASSNLAAVSGPNNLETIKIKTPFQTGHTGNRAKRSMEFMARCVVGNLVEDVVLADGCCVAEGVSFSSLLELSAKNDECLLMG